MGDMYFGYHPRGAYAILRGAIAGLRIDSSVLSTAQTSTAAASKSATPHASTRYLGTFGNSPNSAVTTTTYTAGAPGFDVLTNTDQTQDVFDPGTGRLVATRDRLGNQIDYVWDSSNQQRILRITDHAFPDPYTGRSIKFCYPDICSLPAGVTVRATDLGGRTVDYTVNPSGDLVRVAKSNQVPDPFTGVPSTQTPTTLYSYAPGHLLQRITDPRGANTSVNYVPSYRQVLMPDGPTAYCLQGESNGTAAADSSGTFPGTLSSTGLSLGQGGPAFGGSNSSMKVSGGNIQANYGSALNPGGSFSLAAWLLLGRRPPAGHPHASPSPASLTPPLS